MRWIVFIAVFCASTGFVTDLTANEQFTRSDYFGADLDDEARNNLAALIKEITSDKDRLNAYREEIRHRTVLCKSCHGLDGKAITPLTPNLAGQNADYLIDQMRRFKSKDRFDYWMSSMAAGFSDEDMIKISLYYSTMTEVRSGGGTPGLMERGKKIYGDVCRECHGETGLGNKGYARLAGQRSDYVVKMLKEFRDRTGRRTNPWMTAVSLRLSDEDMEAVATYIANIM